MLVTYHAIEAFSHLCEQKAIDEVRVGEDVSPAADNQAAASVMEPLSVERDELDFVTVEFLDPQLAARLFRK